MAATVIRYDARTLNLLRELTVSQYKLKDQSTFFGLLWSFLNPLVMVGVLFVFFHGRLGQTVEHYGIFLLMGLVQYTHFSNATNGAMRVLLSMRQLTKEVVFPKEFLVFSSTMANSIDLIIAMGVCMLAAYTVGVTPAWSALLLLYVIVLQFLLVTWVSLLLSWMFLFARDVEHIYQVFLRALLFITPIFYTTSFLGDGLAYYLVLLNPLAQLIELSRSILIQGMVPAPRWLFGLLFINLLLLVVAFRLFKAFEPRLAEYV
jgi:ABC-type polysaccharide/polyol phosphate export permease